MVKIYLKNNQLSIIAEVDSPIFSWYNRLYFHSTIGFDFNSEKGSYVYELSTKKYDLLIDILKYLDEETIDYKLDTNIKNILKNLHIEQAEFETIVRSISSEDVNDTKFFQTKSFKRSLYKFQKKAVKHFSAVKHGANFSVPGSGKTTVIYSVFDQLSNQGVVEKILVIGPRSCFYPWESEAKECFHAPIPSARLTGSKTDRFSKYLQYEKYILFLCTYQTLVNDLDKICSMLEKNKFFLVIDESHNIKKIKGGVWSEAALALSRYAIRRGILSGTPMPNSIEDIWTQFTFLWPNKQLLGEKLAFITRCQNKNEIQKISNAVKPFFFRTTKTELHLPKPIFKRIKCQLNPYQKNIYRALSVKILKEIELQYKETVELRKWRRAKLIRLIQTASNPALLGKYSEEFDIPPLSGEGASVIQLIDEYPRFEKPIKIEMAFKIANEIFSKNDKVIIWTTFIHNIKMLQKMFSDINVFSIYGAIPLDDSEDIENNREQQIRDFKSIKGPAVLLANPAACAESISLHKQCYNAIYLDRTFNCGQYLQSLDRIHRIGLSKKDIVTYYILLAEHSIDETIDRRLSFKEKNMTKLLEDDLPIGTFETEIYQMEQDVISEDIDFDETISDLKYLSKLES